QAPSPQGVGRFLCGVIYLERFPPLHLEFIHPSAIARCVMTPETEGSEEKGPSGVPFVNDPGNEDPGSLMDDAQVPLIEGEEVEDAEIEDESYD
ncbi:hypothetical protein J7E47_25735, partial [Pseudomonas fluorescens]|nr:hypothetical protein [Pseudomonas fluorescens]